MPRAISVETRFEISLHQHGFSFHDIAYETGVSVQTVSRLVKRYENEHDVRTHYYNCHGNSVLDSELKEMILLKI